MRLLDPLPSPSGRRAGDEGGWCERDHEESAGSTSTTLNPFPRGEGSEMVCHVSTNKLTGASVRSVDGAPLGSYGNCCHGFTKGTRAFS